MREEFFRIIAFTSVNGGIGAQCLELGQSVGCGRSVDESIKRVAELSYISLIDAHDKKFSPTHAPANYALWELYDPRSEPHIIIRSDIRGKYCAVFRGYDRTDVSDPLELRPKK